MFDLLAQPQKPTISPHWPEQMRPLFWWKNTKLHLFDTLASRFSLALPRRPRSPSYSCMQERRWLCRAALIFFIHMQHDKEEHFTDSFGAESKAFIFRSKLLPSCLGAGQAAMGRFIKSEMWSRLWWRVSEERGVGWSSGQGQKTKERGRQRRRQEHLGAKLMGLDDLDVSLHN